VAFSCLAGRRSGDIYTAGDLLLLASVAERCAEVIARIDAETLAREVQAVQAALRRYVPGAVAERVLAGDALAPSEREVSVLFVDIRGYTSVAEKLQASEVFATLNEHTERVSRVVQEAGGTTVEFQRRRHDGRLRRPRGARQEGAAGGRGRTAHRRLDAGAPRRGRRRRYWAGLRG
jgi:class 3 adenylate cyclase